MIPENDNTIELLDPEIDEAGITDPHDITFWVVKYAVHKETGQNYVTDIIIDYLKLLKCLALMGFLRLDINKKTHMLVRVIHGRVIQQSSPTLITDTFEDHLAEKPFWLDDNKTLSRDRLRGKFVKSLSTYFKEEKLFRLRPDKPIGFQRDTQHAKFFYYQNGFVKVTKEGTEFNSYDKLDAHIWDTEILNRNYVAPQPGKTAVFEQFITKLCTTTGADTEARVTTLKQIIGYLLHTFTDYKMMAILLTDSKISEENEANGRTGKTLLTRAIGWMLSADPTMSEIPTFVDINGKDFDPTISKKYQMVGLETKVICLNDVKRWFDVDTIYNDVTEGVTVERKFMQPFKVQAKFILTTNKTIKIEGDSSKDRFFEFEVSDYFSKSRTPAMEFNHWFFRDWKADEWALFDSFMFGCMQSFFANDSTITETAHINLDIRKLHENIPEELLNFLEDQQFETDKYYDRKELYHSFLAKNEDFAKKAAASKFDQKRFTAYIKTYANYHPALQPYNKERDEKRNDGTITFCFRLKK